MSNTTRAEFEVWAKSHGRIFLDRQSQGTMLSERYMNVYTQEAWVGWQAAQSQRAAPAEPGSATWKLVPVEPTEQMIEAGRHVKRTRLLDSVKAIREGRDPDELMGKTAGAEYRAMLEAAPAPPVPASVQEIMPLVNAYVRACTAFNVAEGEQIQPASEALHAAYRPFEAALTTLVDDNHRLQFEMDGVNAMRRPEWINVDAERPVMADEDDDVEVWTWDGNSVREDEYGGIFEQPAGPAVGGWVRVGDGFAGDSYTRQATHWMPRHKPPPPTPGIAPEQGENHG